MRRSTIARYQRRFHRVACRHQSCCHTAGVLIFRNTVHGLVCRRQRLLFNNNYTPKVSGNQRVSRRCWSAAVANEPASRTRVDTDWRGACISSTGVAAVVIFPQCGQSDVGSSRGLLCQASVQSVDLVAWACRSAVAWELAPACHRRRASVQAPLPALRMPRVPRILLEALSSIP